MRNIDIIYIHLTALLKSNVLKVMNYMFVIESCSYVESFKTLVYPTFCLSCVCFKICDDHVLHESICCCRW